MIAKAMRPLRTAHQDRVGCGEQRVRVLIADHDGFARRMIHTASQDADGLVTVTAVRTLARRWRSPATTARRC